MIHSIALFFELTGGLEHKNPEVLEFAYHIQKAILEITLNNYLVMIDRFPKTKLLNRNHYEIAEIYRKMGYLQLAESYYLLVLKNPQSLNFNNENTESYYRNDICLILSKMYIDYKSSLKYLYESKKNDDILESQNPMIHSSPLPTIDSSTIFDNLYKIVQTETKLKNLHYIKHLILRFANKAINESRSLRYV